MPPSREGVYPSPVKSARALGEEDVVTSSAGVSPAQERGRLAREGARASRLAGGTPALLGRRFGALSTRASRLAGGTPALLGWRFGPFRSAGVSPCRRDAGATGAAFRRAQE